MKLGAPSLPSQDPFYQPPAGFASQPPGTVLATREVDLALLGVIGQRVTAWQLLYRSNDLNRQPQAAVTTVVLPTGADVAGPRPLLAYQCAIDAVAEKCFPSYALRRGARAWGAVPQFEWLIIANALRRGWAVSIADHEGPHGAFGAPREPGYRVLDGIRAATSFEPLGVSPEAPVALWGYSGGGMATSWVAEMAPEYAPELNIVGAALGAPVGDPGEILLKLNGSMMAGLPAMVIAGIRHIYPDLDALIRSHANVAGLERLDRIEKLTTVAAIWHFRGDDLDHYVDTPLADLLASPEVVAVFDDLRLGMRAPACPVMVVAPTRDRVISVVEVDGQVQRYLEAGVQVNYLRDRLSGHTTLMVLAAPAVLEWLSDRIAGAPLPAAGVRTVRSIAGSRKRLRGLLGILLVAAKVVLGRPLGPRSPGSRSAGRRARRAAA